MKPLAEIGVDCEGLPVIPLLKGNVGLILDTELTPEEGCANEIPLPDAKLEWLPPDVEGYGAELLPDGLLG